METNDYGDVFLGGNYIEVGISKHGSFGTSTGPKTGGWHKPSNQSGIGLLSDEDGWNVGEPSATGDFFLPGTKEERWILAYKKDDRTYEHQIADRNSGAMGSWLEEPRVVDASDLANGKLKAIVTGITNQNVKIVITYSFDVNDLFYTTDVEIINVGTSAIEDVRFVRSFDPDQDADIYSKYDTYNKVICNPVSDRPGGTDNYALVVARGGETLSGYFFLAFDNRARASWDDPLSPGSAYSSFLWDTASVTEKTFATDEAVAMDKSNLNGYTLEDGLIALTFNIGSLSANGSTTLQYMSSLDPDVQGSLQKVLSGQVDYTEEVLTGFTVGSNYHITCDGVTYVFENVPASTIPLSGTAPTTADSISAVSYDFLGKTIVIVEKDDLGENVSTEQTINISSRPGEVNPGETLPDVPAPVIENITTTLNSITIDPAVEIQEYSLDGQNWISPTDGKILFTGLEDGTGYTVYSRVAATSEYPASQICSLLVYTDAYKVTLNYGALGSEVTYAQASGKLDLDIPVFDGYIFMGWYDDAEFTTPHDFTIGVEGDVTLYAKFADYEGDKKTLQDAIDALEADVTELNKLTENGGTIDQIKAKIAAIESQVAALDAIKDKYAEADTVLKQELQAADTAINNAITALTGRVETLESELTTAKNNISTNTSKVAQLTAELAALNASLTDLSNKLTNDYATKAELTSAINSAKDTINSAIDALTVRVQDLEADLAAVNSKVDTNTSDVTALKSDVAALNTWKAQSQSTIAALETLTATQSADIARLKTAVQDLEAALAAAEARIDDAEDRIAALEGKVSALEIAKQNLDAAVAALNAAINNKADTATLNQKVTDLIAAIAAAEDAAKTYADGKDTALQTQLTAAIATAKGEAITAAENLVNTAKAELQTAIHNKADIATLNAKVAELNAAIETAEATAKAYTDSAVTTLNAAIITAKDEAVDAAKDLVDAAKAQLQAAIDNKADTAAVNAAIANLQNAITALQNAKDNYIAADAALKAELEAAIAKAKQEAIDAAKGHIPYIGTNGNWWIGDTDTGVDANGIKGDTGNGIASITTKKENGVTTVTITFTDPEKEPVVFTISDGETGATGADGVGVAKVEKTATNGNVDTYTITLTNGKTYTFTVTNGKDGADGKDGENGKDGLTPFIGENGNWWIGDTDTGVKAVAEQTAQKGTDTITVVAIVVASVALLSNLALVVWIVTKKKKILV